MPNYEYLCHACDHRFEEFQRLADRAKPTKKPCPQCGKKKVEQHFGSAPAACDPIRMGTSGGRGMKVDKGFKEVISKIKKAHPRNTMPDY